MGPRLIIPQRIKRPMTMVGMEARYRLWAINKFTGKRRPLGSVSPNTMLIAGMNSMASGFTWFTHVQVGSGSTLPDPNDTTLENWIAGTDNDIAVNYGARSSEPWYGWKRKTFRFNVGEATGNLSEVGCGWGSSGATLVSRARLIDQEGNYTTQTVLSDELVDVDVEIRYYPPLVDTTGTVTLNGIVYNWTHRACQVNDSALWGSPIGQNIGILSDVFNDAFDGTIGSLTQSPNGVSAELSGSVTNITYSNNSFKRSMYVFCDQNGWRLANGIRSIRFRTTVGAYQTEFSAQGTGNTIPKTTSSPLYEMNMYWWVAWAEIKMLQTAVGTYNLTGQAAGFTVT